uniref:Uncharacterized protein n=1 Tax=Gloeothece verrucosa (strain PCC 7822) TaxID=497965 RepID=E0U6P8_GLOV7|nr:hypothetical protein Cyan7822_2848 [Gloeothece verrucosa PCC 7822]
MIQQFTGSWPKRDSALGKKILGCYWSLSLSYIKKAKNIHFFMRSILTDSWASILEYSLKSLQRFGGW